MKSKRTFKNKDLETHREAWVRLNQSAKPFFKNIYLIIWHFLCYFHCSFHCVGLYMTCEHWPWWALLHTKGQWHHLQKEKDPPKYPLSRLSHFLSIIDIQLSVEKPARLSVDLFDEYFSWQTGHLTLHQSNVWLESGRSFCPHAHMHAHVVYTITCCYYYSALNVLLTVYLH